MRPPAVTDGLAAQPAEKERAMPEFDSTVRYAEVNNFPNYRIGTDGSLWSINRKGRVGVTGRFSLLALPRHRKNELSVGKLEVGYSERKYKRHSTLWKRDVW